MLIINIIVRLFSHKCFVFLIPVTGFFTDFVSIIKTDLRMCEKIRN